MVLNLRLVLSLRNSLIEMIKIVHKTLVIVSNMVDQGRIILQNFGLCNLSLRERKKFMDQKTPNSSLASVPQSTFVFDFLIMYAKMKVTAHDVRKTIPQYFTNTGERIWRRPMKDFALHFLA